MTVAAILAVLGIFMPVRAVEVNLNLAHPVMIQVEVVQALETPPTPTPVWTKTALKALASSTAQKYGLNTDHFLHVIACESSWDPTRQSDYADASGPNGREDSWGIAQIHLPAHPNVTKEQALDPTFAIDWMAQQWVNDNASIWTCWRILYG